MKKFFKSKKGQKGFTLVELLVVIAILGILAAVIVPNVGSFLGSGTVEAANTEAHNVQTAVMAYMVDNNLTTCTGSVGPLVDIPVLPNGTSVKSFITGTLQAVYIITDGEITDADSLSVVGSQWAGLTYTPGQGWAE